MNLISIDPGNKTGWAVFANRVLVRAGVDKKSDLFRATAPTIPGGIILAQETLVLVELPRWYPHDHKDVNDLLDLCVLVGEVKRFYESQSCAVELVFPRTWKGTQPKDVCGRRVLASLTPDEVALLPKRPRAKDHDNNMVDAVGLGLWKLGRLR